jgi:hypothetical protein
MSEKEPMQPAPRPQKLQRVVNPKRQNRSKVNKAAVLLGDPVIVFGGFLRAFSRRKR